LFRCCFEEKMLLPKRNLVTFFRNRLVADS